MKKALVIVLVGILTGLAANQLSPRGIPLITPPKVEPKPDIFIPLAEARAMWEKGSAMFLDAREPADYVTGHIGGAFNLPALSFEDHFVEVSAMLVPSQNIIAYCDGTQCDLSQSLATRLKQLGFTNTHILFNGWTAWKQAGGPISKGDGK